MKLLMLDDNSLRHIVESVTTGVAQEFWTSRLTDAVFYTHSASVSDLTSASESLSTALNVSSSVNKSIFAML